MTSNAIGSTIDLKQIEELPLVDRDLTVMASFAAGYANGTWNGLPGAAQVNSVDGVIGQSSRMKDFGNAAPGNGTAASPRIQNIQEISVQTSQLDANQGYGQGNMQVAFVTRSGTNRFHGRLFADLQNSSFNANSWMNDYQNALAGKQVLPVPLYHKNDFGGSIGGPILKDKLFFFFGYERDGIPGQRQLNENTFPFSVVMTPAMQQGDFTYMGTDSTLHTVNLFTLAGAQPGLQTQVDPSVANEMTLINKSLQYGATLESTAGIYNAAGVVRVARDISDQKRYGTRAAV